VTLRRFGGPTRFTAGTESGARQVISMFDQLPPHNAEAFAQAISKPVQMVAPTLAR
jgi:hypothetical protein